MSNKVIQVIEKVAGEVAHVVELPFTYAGKIEALISTGEADEPELKAAIVGLVGAGEGLVTDVSVEIASDGSNIGEYLQAAKDAATFASYFKWTFLPVIEKVFGDVQADVTSGGTAPEAASVPASAPAGLHTVVPA